jgi:putative transposase
MKISKFTESQIVAILKESENGLRVADICRSHSISQTTLHKWRSKYGGMDASLMKRLKGLETENARLKKMYADNELNKLSLKKSLAKKFSSPETVVP